MRELRERVEPALRILCLILAGCILYELAGLGLRWNPFHSVRVPELPRLTAIATATNSPPAGARGTNQLAATKGTNGALPATATNAPVTAAASTNSAAMPASNSLAHTTPATVTTNLATKAAALAGTNGTASLTAQLPPRPGTNAALISTNHDTNLAPVLAAGTNHSPALPLKPDAGPRPGMPGTGMGFNGPGSPGPGLPPALQARISRITDSEILGPVMHPLPKALLGIAGDVAFLRSDSGQTGLVKPGDTLDDLKLLRVGINRVLIEQNGQKQELMIFSGYGGESLLQNDSTNENKHL